MQGTGDEPVYVISVAARLAELPCWVLRVLDEEGIVVPVRTESNRRLYSNNDLVLLARVRHLTEELGVNIKGVKVILEMERTQRTRESTGGKEQKPEVSPANALPPALPAFPEETGLVKTNGSHS